MLLAVDQHFFEIEYLLIYMLAAIDWNDDEVMPSVPKRHYPAWLPSAILQFVILFWRGAAIRAQVNCSLFTPRPVALGIIIKSLFVFVPIASIFHIYLRFPQRDQHMRPSQTSSVIPQVYRLGYFSWKWQFAAIVFLMLPSGVSVITDLAALLVSLLQNRTAIKSLDH
jgi:hypothetical protein